MQIAVILHNIRSTHNVGAILRTCDGFGVSRVYCTGYTPYPALPNDRRLPHLAEKITKQIHKTALGAEESLTVHQSDNIMPVLKDLKSNNFKLVALEQSPHSTLLQNYMPGSQKIALLLGEEVHGITPELLNYCDEIIEIPMLGNKESFNVSVATGIALYGMIY